MGDRGLQAAPDRTTGTGVWRPGRAAGMNAALAAMTAVLLLSGCAGPQPPGPRDLGGRPEQGATPTPPASIPPTPWRDAKAAVSAGTWQWHDARRGRTIEARWIAAAEAQALLLVLPGLARGDELPQQLGELLAQAGFAVVALGHPGNETLKWRALQAPPTPAAPDTFKAAAERQGEFKLAARRMFAADAVAERAADVRYVLDVIAQTPPSWLSPAAAQRIGAIGVGLGAQTVQWLIGEQMARDRETVAESRIAAAALVGPFVGFDGPGMHQRYRAIRTPLLVAYGLAETDPFGLGMTAQQRRAMVDQIDQARVVELRLPTRASIDLLSPIAGPGMTVPVDTPGMPAPPSAGAPPRGGREPGGGRPGGAGPLSGPAAGAAPGMPASGPLPRSPAETAALARSDSAARIALLFSLSAFFEVELLGNADAREWLEGPHPGPAQWTLHPPGRAARAPATGTGSGPAESDRVSAAAR